MISLNLHSIRNVPGVGSIGVNKLFKSPPSKSAAAGAPQWTFNYSRRGNTHTRGAARRGYRGYRGYRGAGRGSRPFYLRSAIAARTPFHYSPPLIFTPLASIPIVPLHSLVNKILPQNNHIFMPRLL